MDRINYDRSTSSEIRFIRMLRGGFLLGATIVEEGDVLPVKHPGDVNRTLYPVQTTISQDRARELCDARINPMTLKATRQPLAVPDPGPARRGESPVTTASLNERVKTAERAVAKPQRSGAM